jgi:multidrug efflux pump subunit AcrA (membrane-fusion protein)
LSRLRSGALDPLLEEEIRLWREQLRWDYRASADLVRHYVEVQSLNGFALLAGGEALGYSYFVVDEHKGALVVPPSAVVRDEAGQAALYVVKGDMAERTAVTIGIETPEIAEVASGVSEGQTVLTSAVHGLGDKVRLGHK